MKPALKRGCHALAQREESPGSELGSAELSSPSPDFTFEIQFFGGKFPSGLRTARCGVCVCLGFIQVKAQSRARLEVSLGGEVSVYLVLGLFYDGSQGSA